MFVLTAAAAEQIARAAQEQPDNPPLRVAAKFDDDGELVYGMGFDHARDDDIQVESEGLRILIAPRSQTLLDSATLDFVEIQPGEFQFVFRHERQPLPPTTGGCGTGGCGSCGSSRGNGGGCA